MEDMALVMKAREIKQGGFKRGGVYLVEDVQVPEESSEGDDDGSFHWVARVKEEEEDEGEGNDNHQNNLKRMNE